MMRFLVLILALIATALPAAAREKAFLPIAEITSEAGIKFWLVTDHRQPLLALSFGFRGGGSVNETAATQGLARMTANTLDEGAGPYDSRAFQAQLEENAISLSFSASRDHFYGAVQTLTETRDTAANLLSLALRQPRFDADAVGRMAEANLTRIRANQPDPEWLAARLFNDKAYAGHSYALNAGGTLSTLPALSAKDIRGFWQTYLTKDRLVIALAGDLTADQAKAFVDRVFADLPAQAPATTPMPQAVPLQNTGKTFLFAKDIPQTVIMLAAAAPARDDPDYAAFIILNNILGGSGFGSRLMETIREQAGLTYGIYSGYDPMDYTSLIAVQSSTENNQVARLIEMTTAEITRLAQNGVSAAELADAKGYLLGSMPMALDSTDSIAGLMLSEQLDGHGVDHIDRHRQALRAVTTADVARVAQKWLHPDRFLRVMVGKPDGITNAELVKTIPNIE